MSAVTYTPAQMTAIRNELLESHLRITAKNEALIKELKAQIEALELENEAHEDEIACINDLKDAELAWIAEPVTEAEIQAKAESARQAFQAAEAEAELRRREADREDENKVICDKCEECYVRNSRDHDEFIYDKDGEYGICGDCYDGEYDEDSEDEDEEEEDEEEEEEDEGVCYCLEDYEAYQNGAEYQEIERQREAIKKMM